MDEPRVVLWTRHDCHLCGDARTLVRDVCEELGEPWVERDVDVVGPDGELPADRFGTLVPVVTVDGRQAGHYHLDAARLRRKLSARPAAR